MCPDQCKGLSDAYGEEFDNLYKQYEKKVKDLRQVKADKYGLKF